MAVLLLTAAASALTAGASAFVQIAAAAATAVGSFIDNRLFGPSMGNTTQEGSRLVLSSKPQLVSVFRLHSGVRPRRGLATQQVRRLD